MVFDFRYEFLASAILVPMVWWLMRGIKTYFDKSLVTFNNGFQSIVDSHNQFRKENREIHDEQIRKISFAVAKTKLDDSQTIDIIKEKMWYYSDIKLEYIKNLLKTRNLKTQKATIKRDIKSQLATISQEYIDSLNKYLSPHGELGDIVLNKFPMEKFLDDVYEVVFREPNTALDIEYKINDIKSLMKAYQNIVIVEIRETFKNN